MSVRVSLHVQECKVFTKDLEWTRRVTEHLQQAMMAVDFDRSVSVPNHRVDLDLYLTLRRMPVASWPGRPGMHVGRIREGQPIKVTIHYDASELKNQNGSDLLTTLAYDGRCAGEAIRDKLERRTPGEL